MRDLPYTDNDALIRYLHDFRPVYPAVEWRVTLDGEVPPLDSTKPNAASFTQISALLLLASVLLNTVY